MKKRSYILVFVILIFCLIIPQVAFAENTIGLINDRSGEVRTGPTTSNTSVLRVLEPGQDVIINDTVTNSYGNKWYKVSFYVNGTLSTGYIYSNHITIYKYDSSFEATVSAFPESYRQQIRYLHCLYPQWKFKRLNTGKAFDVDATNFQKSALVDGSDQALRENNTILEGSNWYRANLKTTSYFLDVRNMLKASTALMFEDLAYDESVSAGTIEKILENTYMDSIEEISGKRWAQLFIEAGSVANCSPSFLAVRALQEQGTSGSGGLGSQGGMSNEDKTDTNMYYNIFNIGASGGAQDGIEYAKKQGWTTRESSIIAGAKFISNNYISKKQNTIYLQRFNVDPSSPSSRYGHSYMTNIRAPYSEGKKTYSSYFKNDILELSKTLIIPVYENMPSIVEYPGTMDIITIDENDIVEPTYLKGDVDGNGSITAVDYMLIKNHIMGVSLLTDDHLTRADVNKDGNITAVDYMLIKNHIMGVSKLF